jgi:phosphonate transport system permease protein
MLSPVKATLPIGLVIYTVARTILNGLRSIEALVMAIVFVIAVGIGPFAGVMALGLHTIVSLASSIPSRWRHPARTIGSDQATEPIACRRSYVRSYPRSSRLHLYTMYRWDINVRMSTIIGFVGGGGIGFLLQQNINLLNYQTRVRRWSPLRWWCR